MVSIDTNVKGKAIQLDIKGDDKATVYINVFFDYAGTLFKYRATLNKVAGSWNTYTIGFDTSNFVKQEGKSASTAYYRLDHKFAEPYFFENFESNMIEGKDYIWEDGFICVKQGSFEREYNKLMCDFKENVLNNKDFIN